MPRDIAPNEGWEIFGMMDQHAYLRIPPGADLKVGDMIAFDISHPCLTFDKWREVLIVDPSYRVTEVVETFF
jgi:D-serine dehydratase